MKLILDSCFSYFPSQSFLKLKWYYSLYFLPGVHVLKKQKTNTCTHVESIDSPVVSKEVRGLNGQWVGVPFQVVCSGKSRSHAVTRSLCVQGDHLLNLMRFHSHLERDTITSLYNLCDKSIPAFFWPLSKLHIQTLNFYINS